MASTQQELALQMIAQLRVLDPSISADLGTPERKIVDAVGQALADAQIDLVALRGALDLDSKFGDALDRFLALFGFGRVQSTSATGFVTFSRITASNNDIRIPVGSQVLGLNPSTSAIETDADAIFSTTFDVTLPAGDLSVVAPIRANLAGAAGDLPANTITQFVGNPILGITSVTNETPTSGGRNAESDDEFKTRFKNQVFRNLAGTKDQYLALAAATAYTTRANVIGPISRYREYIQVPSVDDATYLSYDATPPVIGAGQAGEFTSALSDVPYSKYVYTEVPYFVASGGDAAATFFRPEIDFRMNVAPTTKNVGDTLRESNTSPPLGYAVGDPRSTYQPNITFLNIYTGTNPDIQAIRPGDVVLFEHSYVSAASRNDVPNGIANAVDVFIDGGNDVTASVITTRPDTTFAFTAVSTSKFNNQNYRRRGEPKRRPLIGNILLPLFWEPVTDLPDQIVVNNTTYLKNVHYWMVEDVSTLYGTIRARNGIEFSTGIRGLAASDDDGANAGTWTGPFISSQPAGTPVPIDGYLYDRNVVDLQATIEANRQVTTDVLVHKAKTRYFKLDVTVMYSPGASRVATNEQIRLSVNALLRSNYFGQAVQLSDLLQAVHDVIGVDNVRWSSDVPGGQDLTRVYETNAGGAPLTDLLLDRLRPGTSSVSERWQAYFTDTPTSGTIAIGYDGVYTAIPYNADAAALQATLRALTGNSSLLVSGTGTSSAPFYIDWTTNGLVPHPLVTDANLLGGGTSIFMADFFLKDDELSTLAEGTITGDTVAGLIIRQRAQNTFTTR